MAKGRLERPAGPPSDPHDIFKQSMRFLVALHGLHLYRRENPHLENALDVPMLVLTALQSEIIMKALIVAQGDPLPRGHDLRVLFDRLRPETQTAVEIEWDRLMAQKEAETLELESKLQHKVPRGLKQALDDSKESFEELRYIYETGEGKSFIVNLPLALSAVALSLRPDWNRI